VDDAADLVGGDAVTHADFERFEVELDAHDGARPPE
jgi:hypothetical protein